MKKEALLYKRKEGRTVRCGLCSHYCEIMDGCVGFCRVRQNSGGVLYTLVYGDPVAVNVDPIEKKPLYHFLPGSKSFSIGTAGCNFRCGFCQNWQISQAGPESEFGPGENRFPPEAVVRRALSAGCESIAYTYNEPTVFFEYALDTAVLAKKKGLKNVFVTNGYMTVPMLDEMRGFLDAANIDLKGFSEDYYVKNCGAHIKPVLNSMEHMKKLGIWIEITTLLIPGLNDSSGELKDLAEYIAFLGRETPWHVSRFHPDYNYAHYKDTPIAAIEKALEIGREAGLKHVYQGNTGKYNDTVCCNCKKVLIARGGYAPKAVITEDGACPECGEKLDGIWK